MSVQQTIASRLKADDLTAEQCRELQAQAHERMTEVQAKLAPIAKGDRAHMPVGLERQRVLTEGTPEQLAKLNREHDLLTAELEQLEHQRNALTQRRTELLGRDAIAGMPQRYATLAESLERAAQARAAYVEALREVESLFRGIEAARTEAARAGAGKPVAADPALYELVDAIAPGNDLHSDYLHGRHSLDTLSSALGIERQQDQRAVS